MLNNQTHTDWLDRSCYPHFHVQLELHSLSITSCSVADTMHSTHTDRSVYAVSSHNKTHTEKHSYTHMQRKQSRPSLRIQSMVSLLRCSHDDNLSLADLAVSLFVSITHLLAVIDSVSDSNKHLCLFVNPASHWECGRLIITHRSQVLLCHYSM